MSAEILWIVIILVAPLLGLFVYFLWDAMRTKPALRDDAERDAVRRSRGELAADFTATLISAAPCRRR